MNEDIKKRFEEKFVRYYRGDNEAFGDYDWTKLPNSSSGVIWSWIESSLKEARDEWISVKDKLPEDKQSILFYIDEPEFVLLVDTIQEKL